MKNAEDRRGMWEKYALVWKTPSSKTSLEALGACVSPRCVYRDPLTQAEGHEALLAYMAELQKQIPGAHFQTTWFHTHHERSIARWNMCNGSV